MEAERNDNFDANRLFADILETLGYRIEPLHFPADDEGYQLLGAECSDTFFSAREIIERLENIQKFFVSEFAFIIECYGLDVDDTNPYVTNEIPDTPDGILEMVQKWENLPTTSNEGQFYNNNRKEIEIMNLFANRLDEVDLKAVSDILSVEKNKVNEDIDR